MSVMAYENYDFWTDGCLVTLPTEPPTFNTQPRTPDSNIADFGLHLSHGQPGSEIGNNGGP